MTLWKNVILVAKTKTGAKHKTSILWIFIPMSSVRIFVVGHIKIKTDKQAKNKTTKNKQTNKQNNDT